jgi:micrococcal nuclease
MELFQYEAEVIRVIDGDTLDASISLGFNTYVKKRIRFQGFNAPESRTRDLEEKKRGLAAKDRVIEILKENNNKFLLKSHGVDDSLQKTLINEGHGVEYNGGKR